MRNEWGERKGERPGQNPASAEEWPGLAHGIRPRLLIFSDIRFLRESLAELLGCDTAFAVVGSAGNVAEALTISRLTQPHMILLDGSVPEGPVAARRLRELQQPPLVVALGLTEMEAEVIAWAEAGISGFIPRSAAIGEIVEFLGDVLRGRQRCSAEVASGLLRRISRNTPGRGVAAPAPQPGGPRALTSREQQIMGLICIGQSNKEIARRLNIGLTTTKSHVHNLLTKLELQRRGQIAQWSRDHLIRSLLPWALAAVGGGLV